MFKNPKMQVLFEDIDGAAKMAGDLGLNSISSVLYFLIAAMMCENSVDALHDMAVASEVALEKHIGED